MVLCGAVQVLAAACCQHSSAPLRRLPGYSMGQRMDCFRPLSGGTKSVSCSTSSPPPMRPLPGKFISFHLGLCWLTWPVLERPLRGGGGAAGRCHPGFGSTRVGPQFRLTCLVTTLVRGGTGQTPAAACGTSHGWWWCRWCWSFSSSCRSGQPGQRWTLCIGRGKQTERGMSTGGAMWW